MSTEFEDGGERDEFDLDVSDSVDAPNLFRREFFGRTVRAAPAPSPGPWTVKEYVQRSRYGSRDIETTWVVLDANSKCVAECERQVDAIHIAENGPQGERDGVTHGRKGAR